MSTKKPRRRRRCPVTSLLRALSPVIDDNREAASYDIRWGNISRAFDLADKRRVR